MNDLSPRLCALGDFSENVRVAADIGCDHGFLSVFLAKSGKAETVWASDVSAQSLEKAKKLAQEEKCQNIRFFLGDGFDPLPGVPDTAILAGWGGRNMAKCLSHPRAKTRLLLQPMSDSPVLYEALYRNGFAIQSVRIVREGRRFYELIDAFPGKGEAFDPILPPKEKLICDETAREYLRFRLACAKNTLSRVQAGENAYIRKNELEHEIELTEEMLAIWPR